jgi:hypothetical protein
VHVAGVKVMPHSVHQLLIEELLVSPHFTHMVVNVDAQVCHSGARCFLWHVSVDFLDEGDQVGVSVSCHGIQPNFTV